MFNKKVRKNARNVLIFSSWKRRNYSAFQTLKKEVIISVLAVSYLISVPVESNSSVPDTTEIKQQYNLDEIEVSAQRAPVLYSQVARVVSVIQREEIEYAPVTSVQELLEYIAGVDVRQRGADGVQADVSIRGGTFDQTLILLNGVNITDPQTGHHNLNLPVSLNQIERIEILKGPAARIYGPNAFSGAINIVTRQPPDNSIIELGMDGGSFGYYDLYGLGSFRTSDLNHVISVSHKSSDGYIKNTDFAISDVFYTGNLDLNSSNFSYQLGAGLKGFGANSFYTPKYPNQYEETNTFFTSVKWQSNGDWHFTPQIYYRMHKDRFELYRENNYQLVDNDNYVWNNDTIPAWYTNHNYHLTNTYGLNLNSWIQWNGGKTSFGFEYRSENIFSNVLGETLSVPKTIRGKSAEYTKSYSRNLISGFLEHSITIGNFSATAGVMGNYIFDTGIGINFFPGIDLSYQIFNGGKIYTSFNTSLRMPTFTDLFYKGPTNIGNPDLKPEKSSTIEGGLKLNKPVLQGSLVLFYRNGNNIIDWVKSNQDDLWQPQNLTHLASYGIEFQTRIDFVNWLGEGIPMQIYFSYLYNNLEKEAEDFISNYVLDNVKHKFVGAINYKIFKNLIVNLKATYQDRDGSFTVFENGNFGSEKLYPPFWIFDGKISYSIKGIKVFCSANNLFNKNYYDMGNVPQAGRWIKAGIIYKLNLDGKE